MYCKDELHVRRDANGNPDMAYYINEAHRLRREAIRQMATQARAGLRKRLQQLAHALHLDGRQPSLHH